MIKFKEFVKIIDESQEHTSAETSLNQTSAGIKHAVKKGLIKPNSVNVDYGGGKHDKGKEHVESNIKGSQLHVHDKYNRSEEHNSEVEKKTSGKSDYVGMHNVLNVIKEPEERHKALHHMKTFLKPKTGVAHITVYEGDKSGKGKMSKKDKGKGSSWQNHKQTSEYVDEVKKVFTNHYVEQKGKHIHVKEK